jgi:hypothetical protein
LTHLRRNPAQISQSGGVSENQSSQGYFSMKISEFLTEHGRVISYYPRLSKLTKSVTATVLLCQFMFWRGKEWDPDGWLYKTQSEIEEETGLSRKEQETARRKLREAGILEEEKRGVPARLYYRVNMQNLDKAWSEILANGAFRQDVQKGQTECAKGANNIHRLPLGNLYAQPARAQSPGRDSTPIPKVNATISDPDQKQNSDQYGHKRKTRKSEKPGTSGLRNRTAIAQKDFFESKESVPVSEPVETTTPSKAVLGRGTVLPRFLPKKKTKGEIEYSEDSGGWLQLPRGSRYARERKIACRMMQEALVDRYEYTDWVEEDGVWFIENTKDDEILPVEEALSSSKGLSLRSLRNYLVTHSGLSQEAFNDDLQEAFESAIALCEKLGDRVFDKLGEWAFWCDGVEELLEDAE